MNQLFRPGITIQYLEENKIQQVSAPEAKLLCGCDSAGVILPYHTPDSSGLRPIIDEHTGKPFVRLRKDRVDGDHKYHQAKSTGVHTYLPSNFRTKNPTKQLAIVEGEFKSLSVTDPNQGFTVPCVGTPGFFGFRKGARNDQDEPKLTEELSFALRELNPDQIVLIGDNDTALNRDFAVAAFQLQTLLRDREVVMFRIDLNEPKGIDDCRYTFPSSFESWFGGRMNNPLKVRLAASPDDLAVALFYKQLPNMEKFPAERRHWLIKKVCTFLAKIDPQYHSTLFAELRKPLGIGKTELGKLVKERIRELARERKQQVQDDVRQMVGGFHYNGSSYYRRNADGSYSPLSGTDNLRRHLQQEHGLTADALDAAVVLIQKENVITFGGKIAGYKAGVHRINHESVLVTAGPNLRLGAQGDCTFLVEFLKDLLGRNEDKWADEQYSVLLSYLHVARRALRNPELNLPGQALFLLGPPGIGKNLLQERIITPLLGGRQFDPADILTGRTPFNDAMLAAEHLVLSDANIPPECSGKFQSQIKRLIANPTQVVSRRFQSQVAVQPIFRLTISANLDPRSRMIVPQLDSGIRDKISILRCYRPENLPPADPRLKQQYLTALDRELPAFTDVVDKWKIPGHIVDERFGVTAFQHPGVLAVLGREDPLYVLAGWLNQLIKLKGPVAGTAKQIWSLLEFEYRDALTETMADHKELGRFLHRLKYSSPDWNSRIDQAPTEWNNRNRVNVWSIK